MIFFHQNLKILRKKNDLTQKGMGEVFDVTQAAYQRWEKDMKPSMETLVGMARYFKVSLDDFICRDMDKEGVPEQSSSGFKNDERTKLMAIIGEKDVELKDRLKKMATVRDNILTTIEGIVALDGLDDKEEWAERFEGMKKELDGLV